jgi:hypothetical protein
MIVVWIPLFVCVLGLVVYIVSAVPKVAEVGRLMFAIGLFVTLFEIPGHIIGH